MQLTGAYEPDVPLHYFPNKHTRNAEAAPVGLVSGPVELEKLSCSVDRREVMWLRLSESCCRHRSTCSGPVPLGVNVDARYLLKLVWTPALELRFFLLPRPLDSSRCSGGVNEHSKTGGKNDLQMQVIRSEPRQDSTWAEVKCQSSCLPDNPTFIWYKNGQKIWRETTSLSYEDNFNSSYSCAVKGHEKFPSPPVYAPQVPSVSVSPSAEIVEGNSVNLTCSSDANPAANYTWFKKDGNPDLQLISKQQLVFSSILFSDAGQYYCTAENKLGRRTSVYKFVNVESNIRLTLLVLLLIPLFVLSLFTSWYCWIQLRKKKKLTSNTESNGTTEMKESDSGPDYENISAFRSVTAAQTDDTEEQSDSYNVYENISEVNRCSTD